MAVLTIFFCLLLFHTGDFFPFMKMSSASVLQGPLWQREPKLRSPIGLLHPSPGLHPHYLLCTPLGGGAAEASEGTSAAEEMPSLNAGIRQV